jgi:hypothetical protein
MNSELFWGFTEAQISALGSIGQFVTAFVALLATMYNFEILRRINVVDSMRRVNDKFTELNILELQHDDLIALNHMVNESGNEFSKEQILNAKRINMIFNHINVLEGVFIEMNNKTMNKRHAMKILDWFVPKIVNNPTGYELVRNSGYDDDFVNFCTKYKSKDCPPSTLTDNDLK